MAIKYAVASGNWSDTATWDGGVKPAAGDVVHADGYTVTIDEDTPNALLALYTTQRAGGTIGGRFLVTGTRTIYAGTIKSAGTNLSSERCIIYSGGAGTTLTIDTNGGTISGADSTNNHAIHVTGTDGTLVIYGDVLSGGYDSRYGIQVSARTSIEITGDVYSTVNRNLSYVIAFDVGSEGSTLDITGNVGGYQAAAIYSATGSITVTIVGDILSNSYHAIEMSAGSGHTVTVTGDVFGSTGGGYGAIRLGNTSTVTITGNITGGSTGYGVYINTGTISITGDVTGGSGSPAVVGHAAITTTIIGNCIASANMSAVGCYVATAPVYLAGTMTNNGPVQAVFAMRLYWDGDNQSTWTFKKWDGTTNFTLYSAGAITGMPSAANVRKNTVYGPSNELLGACAMPDPATVALGTPVDNTTGTAVLGTKIAIAG